MKTRAGLLCVCLAGAVQAATEFGETIPTEVAEIFLGVEPGTGAFYSDIADDFPAFAVPDGFSVAGSVERARDGTSVYLRSGLGSTEALEALVQALAAEGWQTIGRSPVAGNATGFIGGRATLPGYASLCHDALGNLQVIATAPVSGTVLTLSHRSAGQGPGVDPDCSAMTSGRPQGGRDAMYRNPLEAALPRLELPAEGSVGRPAGSTGNFSGSNDTVATGTTMQIDWELAQVYAHFASQVAAQDWQLAGAWETSITAGGSWTRTTAEGLDVLGILTVIRISAGDYKLEFRVMSVPAQGGG